MKTDFQTYHDLQAAMRCMIHAGQLESDAFKDAWQQCEDLKNRNGGFPPIPDEEAEELEDCEVANMEGTR